MEQTDLVSTAAGEDDYINPLPPPIFGNILAQPLETSEALEEVLPAKSFDFAGLSINIIMMLIILLAVALLIIGLYFFLAASA